MIIIINIYKIINKLNNKIYVGKTSKTLEERFYVHVKDSKRECKQHRPLYKDMYELGENNFKIELLEETTDELGSEREIYWIDKLDTYNNGYNLTFGGDGKPTVNHEEVIELYKKLNNRKLVSEELGIDFGYVKNILIENGIEIVDNDNRNHFKKVKQIDKNTGEVIKIYNSIKDAENSVKSKSNHISSVCKGKRKTAYGYKWEYV